MQFISILVQTYFGQREHYLFKHLHEMGFDLEEKYKNFSSYQVAEEPF